MSSKSGNRVLREDKNVFKEDCSLKSLMYVKPTLFEQTINKVPWGLSKPTKNDFWSVVLKLFF